MDIEYEYGSASDHARALVRLLPSDLPGRQFVSQRLLDVDPTPSERHDMVDFFGNATSALAFHYPIDRIKFTLNAHAERMQPDAGLDLSPGLRGLSREISDLASLAPASPHHYLGASPRISSDNAITSFAINQVAEGMTALDILSALGHALHNEMSFEAGATDVTTPPSVAFAHRHGVCQDFSHVMIAGLRAIGIPAGYVSGFIRTVPPPGQPRLEGADAMHAWVSAWCGTKTGWVEFDPTNACFVALDHIAIAYGRDYADVAPVRGVLRTLGEQRSEQRVDVIAV